MDDGSSERIANFARRGKRSGRHPLRRIDEDVTVVCGECKLLVSWGMTGKTDPWQTGLTRQCGGDVANALEKCITPVLDGGNTLGFVNLTV